MSDPFADKELATWLDRARGRQIDGFDSRLAATIDTLRAENSRMVVEYAGFVYGVCPHGKHADYGFNHENATTCPGCYIDAMQKVVGAARTLRKALNEEGKYPWPALDIALEELDAPHAVGREAT